METTQNFLDNPSGPQSNSIKYKFMTWIWWILCLQRYSHMGGLALMVISPKKMEIFPLLNVHMGDYSTTFEVFQ
jgi:hypothetical protein